MIYQINEDGTIKKKNDTGGKAKKRMDKSNIELSSVTTMPTVKRERSNARFTVSPKLSSLSVSLKPSTKTSVLF